MVVKSTKGKSTTKKPVAKKPVTKKKVTAKKQSVKALQSFKVSQPQQPFFEFKISRQTIYWTILVAFIIVMQLWILKVQLDVMQVTDTLNQQIIDSANE